MKKLLFIIVLLLSGFIALPGNLPVNMEIDSTYFVVDNNGKPPDVDGAVARFADNVYIAHDVLAGRYFNGDNIFISYANGQRVEYGAVEMFILQAITQPDGSTLYSDGITTYTSDDLHYKIYPRGDIILITCYTYNNQPGWGRKFIVMKEVINGKQTDFRPDGVHNPD